MCPGGVLPARFVDAVETRVDRDAAEEGDGLAATVGPAPGAATGTPRAGAAVPRPAACWADSGEAWPGAAAGGCGAAHWVNGACGPPVIAITTAPRQTASSTAAARPATRKTRWRLPDGSAKTGLDSTGGV